MKIRQVVKGLKAATKSFSIVDTESESAGRFQVAGRDFACPVCQEKHLKKNPIYLQHLNPLPQTRKPFDPGCWTLACTNCGHIAFFAKEPNRV